MTPDIKHMAMQSYLIIKIMQINWIVIDMEIYKFSCVKWQAITLIVVGAKYFIHPHPFDKYTNGFFHIILPKKICK